jgi:signal transduction histidine kinase
MLRTNEPASTTKGRTTVDVKACLAEIDVLVRRTWSSTIRLELHAVPDLTAIRCDELELRSAIMHLAFNARDAMPNGGVISIAVAGISRMQIEVRVTDSGLGMTQETLARAFDPFFTTKADGLGGLGLPIVQRFAQEAGGQIELESKLGVGTTATLRLPVSETEPQAQNLPLLASEIGAMPRQPLG